jgi:hypothetical protein
MQSNILVGFGDSWAWGADLDRDTEKTYLELAGQHYNIPCVNFAVPSSSVSHLIMQFQEFIATSYYPKHQYHAVFFLTAKERTFLYQDTGAIVHCSPQTVSLQNFPQEGSYYQAYDDHLGTFNLNVTLLALQRLCEMYGIHDHYVLGWQDATMGNSLWTTVDQTKFINNSRAITTLFHDKNETVPLQQLIDEKNEYLCNSGWHPNQLGHAKIAKKLIEAIKI